MIEFTPDIKPVARVMLLDNYDSFTFNIAQALLIQGATVTVIRNDEEFVTPALSGYTHLVISAGPCGPETTGRAGELIEECAGLIPVLGVCLGHQLLATLFGGTVGRVTPVHGKCDTIRHSGKGLHRGLPASFSAARYHSLAVLTTGASLEITATGGGGMIMGLRHRSIPALEGVQYHPESFMTPTGSQLFHNLLSTTVVT